MNLSVIRMPAYCGTTFQGFFLNRIPLLRRLHWREVIGGQVFCTEGYPTKTNR